MYQFYPVKGPKSPSTILSASYTKKAPLNFGKHARNSSLRLRV